MRKTKEKILANESIDLRFNVEQGTNVIFIRKGCYYKIGGAIQDVVSGLDIIETVQVVWCPVSQKWVEL
jgi:hypothetical protein